MPVEVKCRLFSSVKGGSCIFRTKKGESPMLAKTKIELFSGVKR